MKKGIVILSLVALVTANASADIVSAKILMGEVLENLGSEPVFTLHKTGTEDYNGTSTTLESVLVVKDVDPNPTIFNYRIEYRTFRNGTITHRAAVDGNRIWFYSVAEKTYSSYTYYNVAPASQSAVIFRNLNKLVGGEDQLLMQLGQQAFEAALNGRNTSASKWLPWTPVYSTLNDTPGSIQVESTVPIYRFLDYQTSNVAGINYLSRIVGHTELNRPGRYVVNDWNIEVIPTEFAGSVYTFVPPANARAIASATAQGV
ncbi:MAG: hypothetical protein ACKVQS_07975 [Fimbriimonadaceae bacterium]